MSATQPYTKEFTVTAAGGTPSVHTLRFPARGTLRRFIAKITNADGGSGDTATIKLFSTEDAATNNDNLYLIASLSLTTNAGDSGAIAIDYANREGSHSLMVRKLYARVDAAGTGAKTVAIALTVEQPSF